MQKIFLQLHSQRFWGQFWSNWSESILFWRCIFWKIAKGREREKKNARCCKSCSAFTTEMVLITSSSRTLTSPLTTIIYTRKGNAFLSITKNSLLSDASTYTHRHHLLARKRQPDCLLPSSLCIQSQCSFPLVKIGHWPPDNCWLMVTWEIRIIFGATYLHFKWHFWLLHSTDW